MSRIVRPIPDVNAKLLVKDAAKLLPDVARRRFLQGGASLGALVMLSGCDVTDGASADNALRAISRFNDRVQALLFDPNRLAETFLESAITRPFPFNAYYAEDEAPEVDGAEYELEVGGLVQEKNSWNLERLYALPQETQITRHICVEGWSAIGKWSGVRFSEFLKRIGADTRARYVSFRCAEDYSTSIDMATALHPQTQMTFKFDDAILPRSYGFPMKVRMPTKLGFKNPKHVVALAVTNDYPGGYWEDQGYNWFSGL
jgi:DMSO/TMAO reductase YedYZ molybdopterin-dependent catalytic subunit